MLRCILPIRRPIVRRCDKRKDAIGCVSDTGFIRLTSVQRRGAVATADSGWMLRHPTGICFFNPFFKKKNKNGLTSVTPSAIISITGVTQTDARGDLWTRYPCQTENGS